MSALQIMVLKAKELHVNIYQCLLPQLYALFALPLGKGIDSILAKFK